MKTRCFEMPCAIMLFQLYRSMWAMSARVLWTQMVETRTITWTETQRFGICKNKGSGGRTIACGLSTCMLCEWATGCCWACTVLSPANLKRPNRPTCEHFQASFSNRCHKEPMEFPGMQPSKIVNSDTRDFSWRNGHGNTIQKPTGMIPNMSRGLATRYPGVSTHCRTWPVQ